MMKVNFEIMLSLLSQIYDNDNCSIIRSQLVIKS